jgi:prepilin-type N-terminal cleavage/methylation domain-containing protein
MSGVRRSYGFTLMELIVVIGLIAVLTNLGMTFFFKMSDNWRQTRGRMDLNAKADVILADMGSDIRDVVSARLSGRTITSRTGTAEDTRFFKIPLEDDEIQIPVLQPVVPDGPPVLQRVAYHVEREAGRHRLVRVSDASLAGSMGNPHTIPLADGVLGLRFEYTGDFSVWHTSWTEAKLPRAVRVSMTLMDPGLPTEQISRKAVFCVPVE